MGRTIVIGDIHGCFDELQDLLRVVELRTDDRVIAVGDLIVKFGHRLCLWRAFDRLYHRIESVCQRARTPTIRFKKKGPC